jgi:hypothetical protein
MDPDEALRLIEEIQHAPPTTEVALDGVVI